MNITRVCFCIVLCLTATLCVNAQKKKKNPYDDYWTQQAQEEKFIAIIDSAHQLFQIGMLKESKKKYEKALTIKPKDQKAIAKVRDIDILLKKKANSKSETDKPTLPLPKVQVIDSMPVPIPIKEVSEGVKTTKRDTTIIITPAKPKKQQPLIEKKPTKAQPYKTSTNYRSYLAQTYAKGWTKEIVKEKNKVSTKLVFVHENTGDEYLKVEHHYGAIFYFKNGESISFATYSAATKDFKELE